jgi:hypothetical protein
LPALLRLFAEPVAKPDEYHASTADGDLATVATLLANDFHQMWWSDARYERAEPRTPSSSSRGLRLKVEISAHLARATSAPSGASGT